MILNKKSSILLVLKILEEFSDEDHFLTQQEIIDKISSIYQIDLERKSIASSLNLLEDLGYDIVKGPKRGFALFSRNFDSTEATFLIDAVFSSKSISGRQAQKISENISKCFSKYQRQDYSYLYKSEEINRTDNRNVLYNVSIIQEAMKRKKRIGFQYSDYDEEGKIISRKGGKEYIVSPYFLVNNFGRYYLLANQSEKYNDVQQYKISRLLNINIKENIPIRKLENLGEKYKNFSITKYLNERVYLFGHDVITAKLEITNPNAISYIKEWFGPKTPIYKKGNKLYTEITSDEYALYYWVFQYMDSFKVISPSSFVKKIKEGITRAVEKYR